MTGPAACATVTGRQRGRNRPPWGQRKPPCGDFTRLKARLTALPQLWPFRARYSIRRIERRHRYHGALRGNVVDCTQSSQNEPLALPVAPHARRRIVVHDGARAAWTRTLVNGAGLGCSKRLLSTSADARLSTRRRPATGPAALPPRSGFQRVFVPRPLSTEGLDRSPVPIALRVGGRRAARCLSTSAIGTIHEHNHEPAELRRTSPREAPSVQLISLRHLSVSPRTADGNAHHERSQPRWHRSGAAFVTLGHERQHSPPRSLAGVTSPQPDGLGHLMSPRVSALGLENPGTWRNSLERARRNTHRQTRRKATGLSGPPHTPTHEGECIPPHPRCLPFIG